jgi:hypothetical protein
MTDWIRVQDGLPPIGDEVLVCERWNDTPFVAYRQHIVRPFNGVTWRWQACTTHIGVDGDACLVDDFNTDHITHWCRWQEIPNAN